MNLTGNLSSPDIKFDLDLPTVREEDRDVVRSITSTEEQMNTQIIYLLGIGSSTPTIMPTTTNLQTLPVH